jgi:hypothetical protein
MNKYGDYIFTGFNIQTFKKLAQKFKDYLREVFTDIYLTHINLL